MKSKQFCELKRGQAFKFCNDNTIFAKADVCSYCVYGDNKEMRLHYSRMSEIVYPIKEAA